VRQCTPVIAVCLRAGFPITNLVPREITGWIGEQVVQSFDRKNLDPQNLWLHCEQREGGRSPEAVCGTEDYRQMCAYVSTSLRRLSNWSFVTTDVVSKANYSDVVLPDRSFPRPYCLEGLHISHEEDATGPTVHTRVWSDLPSFFRNHRPTKRCSASFRSHLDERNSTPRTESWRTPEERRSSSSRGSALSHSALASPPLTDYYRKFKVFLRTIEEPLTPTCHTICRSAPLLNPERTITTP